MMRLTRSDKFSWGKIVTALFFSGAVALLTSCATTQDVGFQDIAEEIPDNANRVFLVQEGTPPADVYVDMINILQLADWKLTYAEDNLETDNLEDMLQDAPLVFEARKQITDEMALQITGNVEATAAGGQIIATIEYANSVDTPTGDWNDAVWTTGKEKMAFYEGLESLRHARYDALEFESGVMLTAE